MDDGPNIETWLDIQLQAEVPYTEFGTELPTENTDFDRAELTLVEPPEGPAEVGSAGDFALKSRNLARAFAGQPQLLLLNAKLIALLRRAQPHRHLPLLFHRLWRQKHGVLVAELSPRWLIASAQTMADFGETEAQRRTAAELSVLFSMIKLYESERLFSGRDPDVIFPPGRARARIALDLDTFAIGGGDLDRVVITRIWRAADGDPVARSLARRLLGDILAEERAIFRRLRRMRNRKRGVT